MDDKRLSQTELAEMTGIKQPTFSRWIWKQVLPEPTKLELLAQALGLNEEERATMYRKAGHAGVAGIGRGGEDEDVPLPEELVRLRRMLLPSSALSTEERAELLKLLNAVMLKYDQIMAQAQPRRRRSA
jgi:transcriptional regulator with XRE-family HTH domain